MKYASMDISNKKIIISTHYLVYGAPQALRDYLIDKRINSLLFISHPLLPDQSVSSYENFSKGLLVQKKLTKLLHQEFFKYISQAVCSFIWVVQSKQKYDLFVGVDPLNALVGILLKKIGIVSRIVFYTIDFVPKRFKNKLLNEIYHFIDKICLIHSDEVWNVSYRIKEGREKIRGFKGKIFNKQKVVPIGVWNNKVKKVHFSKIKKHQILFLGYLAEKQGVQLVLHAIPNVIKKIKDFHFLIIGGGDYEDQLKLLTSKLKINKYVTFKGWVKDRNSIDTIMSSSAIAVAMYDKSKDSFTYYADPTKLKDYLSAGLPILMTNVPHNAHEIEQHKCGQVIEYNKNKLAVAIINLLTDERKLKMYKKNALQYIKEYDWEIIFRKNLKRIL